MKVGPSFLDRHLPDLHAEGMPIYDYQCQCGQTFESLETWAQRRERCDKNCVTEQAQRAGILPGHGKVTRSISASQIRGDGKGAKEPSFDPVRRANRPYSDCNEDG